jgi:ketosteroid isomerase-like protein
MTLPQIVTDYFRFLSAGKFEDAAACFAADAFYSHPPYDPGSDGVTASRLEARGTDSLVRLFRARGERNWSHEIRSDTMENRFYIEGVVRDASGAEVLSFLSVGYLDDNGLIARYVAYDSRPPVGSASPF